MFVFTTALALLAPAQAERAEQRPTTVVLIEPKASGALDPDACLDAVEAHGGGAGLAFERSPSGTVRPLDLALARAERSPVLAVFWFETTASQVRVYLYTPLSHAVYVREVQRAESSSAALVEAVGLIAASTATALRSGETLAMRKISEEEWAQLQAKPDPAPQDEVESEPEAVPSPEQTEPVANPKPEVTVPLEVGAGYRGASFNETAPWQHGVGARLGAVLGRGAVLELGYGWSARADIASGSVVRLARHEPELAAGWRWTFGRRTTLDLLGMASVELGRWRSEGRSGTRSRARLGAGLRPAVEVGAGVFVEVRVGVRAALNAFDFVVCDSPMQACSGDAREVVAAGWRVAPEVVWGLSYRFDVRRKK